MEKAADLIRVHDEKSEAWKFVKRDKNFTKQLSTIEETLSRFGLLKNGISLPCKVGGKESKRNCRSNLTS